MPTKFGGGVSVMRFTFLCKTCQLGILSFENLSSWKIEVHRKFKAHKIKFITSGVKFNLQDLESQANILCALYMKNNKVECLFLFMMIISYNKE